MNEKIIKIIKSLVSEFPDEEINRFISICKPTFIKRNDCFISEGQIPRKFGIITNGLVRYLYISNEGKEYTKSFLPENSIISSYTAMKNGCKSPFSIQALVHTEIITAEYEQWKKIAQKNSVWDKFLIALLEKGYALKEKREKDLLLLDAETRYIIFRSEFSTLEPFIKQHLVASYLGITPIALSRIRKKMGLINLC